MSEQAPAESPKPPCQHERLDEDGYCRNCGVDMRSGKDLTPENLKPDTEKPQLSAAEWWKLNQVARNWPLTLEEMFQFAEMYGDYRVKCVLSIYDDLEHEEG